MITFKIKTLCLCVFVLKYKIREIRGIRASVLKIKGAFGKGEVTISAPRSYV